LVILGRTAHLSPVGNKAVQEVAAARVQEQGDYAAVVTNSNYTASARELANPRGVAINSIHSFRLYATFMQPKITFIFVNTLLRETLHFALHPVAPLKIQGFGRHSSVAFGRCMQKKTATRVALHAPP
jgi:hypothetical protein